MPVERLRGYSIAMIAFLAPGQQGPHVWAAVGQSQPLALLQVLYNSKLLCSELKLCQCEIAIGKIQERKDH